MKIEFTIFGNQENRNGNPVPYTRTPRASMWRKDAIRYRAWKDYVAAAYDRQVPDHVRKALRPRQYNQNPIELKNGQTAVVSTYIEWSDGTHGDADNVHKGILDSLFVNDKNVVEGHYTTRMRQGQGSVVVIINIKDVTK